MAKPSLTIELKTVGKKFRNEWIFRNLDFYFESGKTYAITGSNGSGKSTLLQVLSGSMPANEGEIIYSSGVQLDMDNWYREISYSAPYVDLIEEFNLGEFLDFHFKFRGLKESVSKDKFLELVYLKEHTQKPIKQFSSGMKQRLKLGLAFFTESGAVFLDEPTTNLDETGIQWYLQHVSDLKRSKLVIISSNDKREYQTADEILDITQFK